MKLSNLKKYDKFLKSTNKKIVDVDTLSKGVNIKADLIIDDLIYFEPMLRMIVENYNFKNLEKNIEDYISNSIKKETKKKTKRLKYDPNQTTMDFIYSKLLLDNGFIDRHYKFSNQDLKHLRYLINKELKTKNKKKGK